MTDTKHTYIPLARPKPTRYTQLDRAEQDLAEERELAYRKDEGTIRRR